MPNSRSSEPELKRTLGLTSAIMLVVGGVIGSGIFLKPLDIARSLPSPAWIYATWIGVGVICLFGAFAFAELGALFPEAGGQYAFLREAFGRFPAFLYAWCQLLVINNGTLAALAVAFAQGVKALVPMSPGAELAVAVGMILALAVVNHFGVRWGAAVQNASSFAKLGALAAIVIGGFFLGGGAAEAPIAPAPPHAPDLLSGLVTSSIAIFWAYEGWYQLPFNAAELKDPERDLPRGLALGVLILIVTYVLVNAVYLHVVPLDEMRALHAEIDVPKTTVARTFGEGAARGVTLLLCLSIFGAANPNLLSTPRAIYAIAKDGLMPKALMHVHPIYRTPVTAIWSQAGLAIVLVVVLKKFRDITDYVVFAALLFYALTVGAVYVLRRRLPDARRPFRCIGYPVTPALFIAVAAFVDFRTLSAPATRNNALIGLGILAAGVPVYLIMRRRARA